MILTYFSHIYMMSMVYILMRNFDNDIYQFLLDMLGEFLLTFSPSAVTQSSSTPPPYCLLHRAITEHLQVVIKETVVRDTRPKMIPRLPSWSLEEIDPQVALTHRAQLG